MAVMPNIVGELNKQNGIKEEVFTGVGENALEVEKEFPQRTCQFRTNSLKEGRGATLRRQVTLYTHYMSGRLTPVSYTHLDVYKRQGICFIKLNLHNCLSAVSYTHLCCIK